MCPLNQLGIGDYMCPLYQLGIGDSMCPLYQLGIGYYMCPLYQLGIGDYMCPLYQLGIGDYMCPTYQLGIGDPLLVGKRVLYKGTTYQLGIGGLSESHILTWNTVCPTYQLGIGDTMCPFLVCPESWNPLFLVFNSKVCLVLQISWCPKLDQVHITLCTKFSSLWSVIKKILFSFSFPSN